MDAPPLLGSFTPGRSRLHRARPGVKLAALALLALSAGLLRSLLPDAAAAGALGALVLALALLARCTGVGARPLLAQLRRTWWLLAALAAVQLWQAGPARAAAVVAALVACLWAATLVTATTPVPALLASVVAGARPLRRLGVDPERVGLALTLTLTSIPVVGRLLAESRQAAAARGLQRDPRALLVPTVVRTVAHAEGVGEALAARGLG
ncbi:energy-coupling factor transporter transmembrane protein EcfT [Kineococcus sp. T13]|uniref:CbiQ family ECF transporter T component n=1 Tax=Kineococcus vitellinus TaxID=2696565 RepID=UPI0014131F6A|nr:energy-coupling factor transporter transmembrane protein EcfT [Kineococcus vitellinus]